MAKIQSMTIKQIAEALGVSHKTVLHAVKRLFPDILQVGQTTNLNETQAEAVLKELKSNQYWSAQHAGTPAVPACMDNKNLTQTLVDVSSLDAFIATPLEDLLDTDKETSQKLIQAGWKAMQMVLKQLETSNKKLQIELDKSKEYASVKLIEKMNPGSTFAWRELKNVSRERGYPIVRVQDSNYGFVNAYHKDVWELVYGEAVEYAPWDPRPSSHND